MKKQIELARSWFSLAQIFIILAGFFFASAGIMYTNAQNTINFGLDLAERVNSQDCSVINNISSYQDSTKTILDFISEFTRSNIENWKGYLQIGEVLVIISIITWVFGYFQLRRVREREGLGENECRK